MIVCTQKVEELHMLLPLSEEICDPPAGGVRCSQLESFFLQSWDDGSPDAGG